MYQSLFMFAAFIYVAVLGSRVQLPPDFSVFVPENNGSFMAVQSRAYPPCLLIVSEQVPVTRERWLDVVPPERLELPSQSSYAIFNLYALSIAMFTLRSTVGSLGGVGVEELQQRIITRRSQLRRAANRAGAAGRSVRRVPGTYRQLATVLWNDDIGRPRWRWCCLGCGGRSVRVCLHERRAWVTHNRTGTAGDSIHNRQPILHSRSRGGHARRAAGYAPAPHLPG